MIELFVDFKIQSPNIQEHWTKGHKRNKNNFLRLIAEWRKEPRVIKVPCTVTITRIYTSRQKKMDGDNFEGACKNIRDRLANLIIPGLAHGRADDEDLGITFLYAQERGVKAMFKIFVGE
jgi:hypothetical protein